MSRFLVFAGDVYYPYGGWEDYVGSCDMAVDAAEMAAKASAAVEAANGGPWHHIVDTTTLKIVAGTITWSVFDDDPRHALWEGGRPS